MPIKFTNSTNYMLSILGTMLIFVSAIIASPILVVPFYIEEFRDIPYFILPALLCFGLGFLLKRLKPEQPVTLTMRQDFQLVLLLWVSTILFSAIPFMLGCDVNFTLAVFESTSGWTTSGFSVLDVTQTSHTFLMFRSITHFFGGVGLVLVVVCIVSKAYGMRLYSVEGHSDKLMPNLAKTARTIMLIYTGYLIGGTIAYVIAGMPIFDAINHSMAALATGGFSTQTDSIGAYNSVAIEVVSMILMLLGSISFFAHLFLFKGKFKIVAKLSDLRFYLLLIGAAIPLMAFVAFNGFYSSAGESLRVAAFNVISAITTTGFGNAPITNWPSFAMLILIVIMLAGGCVGSTSGGIKAGRVYILFKAFFWNIKRKFLPERNVNEMNIYTAAGKTTVSKDIFYEVSHYFFVYIAFFVLGTAILTIYGYSLQDSMFEFASALGGVGLSVGIVTPDAPPVVLWTIISAMFLGRLEIFIVFIGAAKIAKDLKSVIQNRIVKKKSD